MTARAHASGAPHRRLVSNAVAGAVQAFVSGIVLFALYRSLLARLGAEQVGVWSLTMAWITLARFADCGLPGAMVRLAAVAFSRGEQASAVRMLRRGVLLVAALTGLASLLLTVAVRAFAPAFLATPRAEPALLLWAALTVWVGSVSVAARAGLDALGRVDLRHGTAIVQNVAFLGSALWLVELHGLVGLFWAQALAASASLVATLWCLARELPRRRSLHVADGEQSDVSLRALLRYGLPFQLTTLFALLLDPLVKLLLGQFGGLAHVAWYEMASRLVIQVRGIVVNAMEALVPHVASLGDGEARATLGEDYRRVFAVNLALGSAGLGLLAATLPVIGILWLGAYEPVFLAMAGVLTLAWWCNGLSVPAYFVALGVGVQRWNVLSHGLMAVSTAGLGWALGARFGSMGVLVAFFVAMVLGALVTLVGSHSAMRELSGRPVHVSVPLAYLPFVALVSLPLVFPAGRTWPSLAVECALVAMSALAVLAYLGENRALVRMLVTRLTHAARRHETVGAEGGP